MTKEKLQDAIHHLMKINLWKFDGLPNEIKEGLDELLCIHSQDEMIEVMEALVPEYESEVKKSKPTRGYSGMAGEMHMAYCMSHGYLIDSIRYIREQGS